MKKLFFLLGLSLTFSAVPSVQAASESEQLRQEINTLKDNVERNNSKLAEAINSLNTLQQEVTLLKGNSESGGYFFDQQNKTLRDYDQRISTLEDKISMSMSLLNDIKESKAPEKIQGANEAQTREFQRLLDFINAADYAKALTGFQSFLQKNPKSPLADNAQYWIAESYYSLGDYKNAIAQYQNVIQKYPNSNKATPALYKQGLSFMALKMYPEAKAFFEKITLTSPSSTEAARANVKIKEIENLNHPSPSSQPSSQPTSQPSSPGTPVSGGLYY